jgi:hypothetical protein
MLEYVGVANLLGEKVDILSKGSIVDLESIRVKILEILESGFVQTPPHCQNRMRGRDFSMRDIFNVLQTGKISLGTADGDDVKGIFRFFGHDTDGEPLGVVVQLNEKLNQLNIITGFGY